LPESVTCPPCGWTKFRWLPLPPRLANPARSKSAISWRILRGTSWYLGDTVNGAKSNQLWVVSGIPWCPESMLTRISRSSAHLSSGKIAVPCVFRLPRLGSRRLRADVARSRWGLWLARCGRGLRALSVLMRGPARFICGRGVWGRGWRWHDRHCGRLIREQSVCFADERWPFALTNAGIAVAHTSFAARADASAGPDAAIAVTTGTIFDVARTIFRRTATISGATAGISHVTTRPKQNDRAPWQRDSMNQGFCRTILERQSVGSSLIEMSAH